MTDILKEIIEHKRIEVESSKRAMPEKLIHAETERMMEDSVPSLRAALMSSDTGIIAEFKRRSPSKGWINEYGRAEVIPLSYQNNGATAVSILTDEHYFGGSDTFITAARKSGLTLPVLYKNFVIDEYQLFQARLCGASAVLLIAAALGKRECKSLLNVAHEIGLEVLLELHGVQELDYAELEPDVCGINNRDLGTFVTDINNSFLMAERLAEDTCKISESGISGMEDIVRLRQAGFNGFLIGETFMNTADPGEALRQLNVQLLNQRL